MCALRPYYVALEYDLLMRPFMIPESGSSYDIGTSSFEAMSVVNHSGGHCSWIQTNDAARNQANTHEPDALETTQGEWGVRWGKRTPFQSLVISCHHAMSTFASWVRRVHALTPLVLFSIRLCVNKRPGRTTDAACFRMLISDWSWHLHWLGSWWTAIGEGLILAGQALIGGDWAPAWLCRTWFLRMWA